jgi:hypothetical protein
MSAASQKDEVAGHDANPPRVPRGLDLQTVEATAHRVPVIFAISDFRKGECDMASAKQSQAARRNIKKAARAARRKRTIAHLPKSTRTALGKQASKTRRRASRSS